MDLPSLPSTEELIPINLIFIDAERRDVEEENVQYLAESISSEGLVHPPLVIELPPGRHIALRQHYKVPDNFPYLLIAGAHRVAAFRLMEHTSVPCRVIHDDNEEWVPSKKMVLEYVENAARRTLTWQESVIAISRAHKQHLIDYRKENKKWTVVNTGKLFDLSRAHVHYCLRVADYLQDKGSQIWECKDLTSANQWILQQAAAAARKELNKRHRQQRQEALKPAEVAKERAADLGVSEERYKETIGAITPIESVPSDHETAPVELGCFYEDALQTMTRFEADKFDAIITDPMYGLDKDRISSRSTGFYAKFAKLQSGPAAEEIQEFVECLPEFYRILKPNSWFVFFYDLDYHEQLQRAVQAAGFVVQRWPLIWHKLHANKNEAAKYNTTKNYECAMVCRKGKALLEKPQSSSIFAASREDCQFVKQNKDHPFVKPYAVWQWLCQGRVHPGDMIYEPYAGRGSLLNYAVQNDINFFCSERVEEHYHYLEHNIRVWKTAAKSLPTIGETTTG